jgi:phosphate/phosphite/phosphonate ABC transporter binding protein
MRDYFREVGPPIDFVLYSNYDRQVQALLDRHIDIAWNTNLAWVKVHQRTNGTCRALAMRDVDRQFTTIFVARADSGVRSLHDLKGKRLALGSADSAQAAILPIHYLQQAGVEPEKDCTLLRFNLDVGKHGDTGTSELEVLQALRQGTADAGALGDTTWIKQIAEGRIDSNQIRPIWTSPGYCHCNFTVLADFSQEQGRLWTETLLGMKYDNPRWRGLMDLEGLKSWHRADPAILEGYRVLFDAVERQGLAQNWQR